MGAKILAADGIEVVAVSNGDACVKKLVELDVDMVLADVYMPGLDGYEVCERIKASPEHAGLPVVLLVGALEPFEPDRIAQVRADGVLRKPFEASAVLDVVRPLLQTYIAARTQLKPAEPAHEKTEMMRPPPPLDGPAHHGDTQEVAPPNFDATVRLSESTVRIAPPSESHAAEPPVVAPAPPQPAPPPMAEMSVPVDIPPAEIEMPPPEVEAAEVHAVEIPSAEAKAETAPESFSVPVPAEEYSPGEFSIPDIEEHHEEAVSSATLVGALEEVAAPAAPAPEPEPVPEPAPAAKWVAEPVPVSPEDHKHFTGEFTRAELSGSAAPPPAPPKKEDTPPDWGELLKSVEENMGDALPPVATAATAAVVAAATHHSSAAPAAPAPEPPSASAQSSDLELEIPAEEPPAPPPPPPPPSIDEDELRMAVQLCLESALPGLIDEITAAVLRRLQG
jgi:CheY-like chemotaxis protein